MTVIPDRDIQSALNSALALAFPTTPVAWENAEYLDPLHGDIKAPVVGTPYLRAWLLPAETTPISVGEPPGSCPWQTYTGIFQVDVMYPIGIGFGTPKLKAAEVIAVFKPGVAFTYNTLRIICEKAWPSSGREEDNAWYKIPVNIRYRCESNA